MNAASFLIGQMGCAWVSLWISQPLIGSPVMLAIGSMITKVTTNMCGTLMPEGSAQTSSRPVSLASFQAR